MRWIRLAIVLVILTSAILTFGTNPVKANGPESSEVVVTAQGYIAGLPQAFTAIYIAIGQVDLSWTKGDDAVNTMVRAAFNRFPTSVTDGYQVYYGPDESFSDTAMDFDEYLGRIIYVAWSENASGIFSGNSVSDFVEGVPMLLFTLVFIAVALTVAMFATKNSMLGFPSALFWAILGGYAYTESTTPWGDWQFYLAFASLLGMTTFTALAAFALRERRDTIADEEMDEEEEEGGEGGLVDETSQPKRGRKESASESSGRVGALRDRAKKRRERRGRGGSWGAFE